ncbi:hypothetical protein C8J56DRAFT_948893 [Mycena floridula]|nr:hypothetical protein C8J56DRAFT_948893 [Mycena floridula]
MRRIHDASGIALPIYASSERSLERRQRDDGNRASRETAAGADSGKAPSTKTRSLTKATASHMSSSASSTSTLCGCSSALPSRTAKPSASSSAFHSRSTKTSHSRSFVSPSSTMLSTGGISKRPSSNSRTASSRSTSSFKSSPIPTHHPQYCQPCPVYPTSGPLSSQYTSPGSSSTPVSTFMAPSSSSSTSSTFSLPSATALSTNVGASNDKGFSVSPRTIIAVSVTLVVSLILAVVAVFLACKRYRKRRKLPRQNSGGSGHSSNRPLAPALAVSFRSPIDGDEEEVDFFGKGPYLEQLQATVGFSEYSSAGDLTTETHDVEKDTSMQQTGNPVVFPTTELAPSAWDGGHDSADPSSSNHYPIASSSRSHLHSIPEPAFSRPPLSQLTPSSKGKESSTKKRASFLTRILRRSSDTETQSFTDSSLSPPGSISYPYTNSPSLLNPPGPPPMIQFSVQRPPSAQFNNSNSTPWVYRPTSSRSALGSSPGLGSLTPPGHPQSSAGTPDGLLHSVLAQRLGLDRLGSERSLMDNIDYSRPIGGVIHARVDSTTTFTTVNTQNADTGHDGDHRRAR